MAERDYVRPKRFIVISVDGKSDSHLPVADKTSDYDTLCGMDGDDPVIGVTIVNMEARKVTCKMCYRIWTASRSWKESDFSPDAKW